MNANRCQNLPTPGEATLAALASLRSAGSDEAGAAAALKALAAVDPDNPALARLRGHC